MTPHVVVFGELSPRARVQYTRFLLDNRVQFRKRESDGRYCANIRLALPERGDVPGSACSDPPALPEEVSALKEEEESTTGAPAVPTRFQRLANLIALTGEREVRAGGDATRPYVKESRLVRLLHDIYDSRAEESSSSGTSSADGAPGDSQFARFVRHYLTNRFGLKKIVDQQCWELVEGLASLQHRLDVELFVSFLEGKYPDRALAFFLTARSHVQRLLSASAYRPTLHKSTRTAAQLAAKRLPSGSLLARAAPQWLSKSQLEALGPLVFGATTHDLHIEFAHSVRAFIASDPDSHAARTAARALTVSEFLLLATETRHKAGGAPLGQRPLERHPRHDTNASRDAAKVSSGGAHDGSLTPTSGDSLVSSTGAVALAFADGPPPPQADGDDVQTRLGSLLERAKLRQQQRQSDQ